MDSSIFVDKFYEMNPETEELFPSGAYLKDGMVVLLSNFEMRVLTTDWLSTSQYDRAKEVNRWCKVRDIRITSGLVAFVGEYEDGTMRLRQHPVGLGWLVKHDSMLTIPPEEFKYSVEDTKRPGMLF
jgi:hypothetical protein